MAWLAKNLVAGLVLPPCNLLLLLGLGIILWRRRPRLARVIVTAAALGLVFVSMPATSIYLVNLLEHDVTPLNLGEAGLKDRADAIVVLGGGRKIDAREYSDQIVVSESGFLRLRYAADLKRRTQKPILLTGGSAGAHGPSEAHVMEAALVAELGSKADWLEPHALNTAENAELSWKILAPRGIKRIFLVTHAWHMPRARRAFRGAGFEVVPAPMGYLSDGGSGSSPLDWIPSGKGSEISYVAFHEGIGAIWYRLRGFD